MSQLIVRAGEFTFRAGFEEQLAPKAAFGKTVLWKGAQKTRFEEI
jgi:hypothetical protein